MWLKEKASKKYATGVAFYAAWREQGRETTEPLNTGIRRTAQIRLRELEAARAGPESLMPDEAFRRFLAFKVSLDGITEGTLNCYKTRLDMAAAEIDKPLPKWTRSDIEAHVAAHPKWSARTKQLLFTLLRGFIRWARENGIDCPDFMGSLKAPKVVVSEKVVFGTGEVERLIEMLHGEQHWLELPVAIAAYTGMRQADIRSLTWDQIHTVKVDVDGEAVSMGMIVGKRAKNGQPVRIPIVPALSDVLDRQPSMRKGLVCRIPCDNPTMARTLAYAQKRAEIKPAPKGQNGFGRFRHSLVTTLMRSRVPAPILNRIMGWSAMSGMHKRYSHPDDVDAIRAMVEIFG